MIYQEIQYQKTQKENILKCKAWINLKLKLHQKQKKNLWLM